MRLLTGTINRIFYLSLIVAVLWVKGYLWWVFGLATAFFLGGTFYSILLEMYRFPPDVTDPSPRVAGQKDSAPDEREGGGDEEEPPQPPQRPYRSRPRRIP